MYCLSFDQKFVYVQTKSPFAEFNKSIFDERSGIVTIQFECIAPLVVVNSILIDKQLCVLNVCEFFTIEFKIFPVVSTL